MIENYQDVMNEWGNPPVGCCTDMMTIDRDMDIQRWAVTRTITVLANSDYYYTKTEVDKLLEEIVGSNVTREEVEQMIARAVSTKADKAAVDAIAEQVRQNTQQLLNTYTKEETNSLLSSYLSKLEAINMRDNYAAINDTTLTLNNELEITI
jgi:Arc/MetJ family transcription regulator